MNTTTSDQSRSGNTSICKPLWEICTPNLYRENPFRVVGIHADAGVKEIKRRISEIRDALEVGDMADEYQHAYALNPLPDIGQIQDASRHFDDPEMRIVYEFFWFWPKEWGQGKKDKAIAALLSGDADSAIQEWHEWAKSNDEEHELIGKHNIAIARHIWLLDEEHRTAKGELSESDNAALDTNWRESLTWWEELADSEAFWSLVSARIRMLEDPRLTTGFARRMRATFPEAFDRINALLVVRHIEFNSYQRAELHLEYMDLTHAELDDADKTLVDVTKPLQKKINQAIDQVESQTSGRSKTQAQEILDLIKSTEKTRAILNKLANKHPDVKDDVGEIANRISELCRTAAVKAGNQDEDWDTSLLLIEHAVEIAQSTQQKKKCYDDLEIVKRLKQQDHPILRKINKVIEEADNERNYVNRVAILNKQAAPLLESLGQSAGFNSKPFQHGCDQIAVTLRECGIGLFNLNIEAVNKGFEAAMRLRDMGLSGARALPVGALSLVWISTELLSQYEILASGEGLQSKAKEDHEALDSIKNVIDTLVGNGAISLETHKSEWRAQGVLPMPWVPLCRKSGKNAASSNNASSNKSSSGNAAKSSNSGCFVATAVYGSYNHPNVMLFRQLRDDHLMNCLLGRLFIRVYYSVGPKLAGFVSNRPSLAGIIRAFMDRLANWLK